MDNLAARVSCLDIKKISKIRARLGKVVPSGVPSTKDRGQRRRSGQGIMTTASSTCYKRNFAILYRNVRHLVQQQQPLTSDLCCMQAHLVL